MIRYNGYVIGKGGYWLKAVDPYNPLNLPPFTIRLKYRDNVTPTFSKGTGVQVSTSPNIWDLTYENTNWDSVLMNQTNLLEVNGANTSGITGMHSLFAGCTGLSNVALFDTSNCTYMVTMFNDCSSLTIIPLFDTSSCTNMQQLFSNCTALTNVPLINLSNCRSTNGMFDGCSTLESVPLFNTSNVVYMTGMFSSCSSLKTVPLFNTSSVVYTNGMFAYCYNVQTGAYALYQQMSTQTTPPIYHDNTFYGCGSNTVSGAAELAQIPSDWK